MKSEPIEAVSAGGIVYRIAPSEWQFAVCHRYSSNLWALPKGTPHEGESIAETALREVSEETGLEIEIESDLGFIEYFFEKSDRMFHKRVYFFLMKATGGSTDYHDDEFDEIHWLGKGKFPEMLTHLSEQEIATKAVSALVLRNDNE